MQKTDIAARINASYDVIAAFCRRWNVVELAFFGSVLRGDFRPDSDIDVLVTFAPGTRLGFAFAEMHAELEELLGRKVDLLTRRQIEDSHNHRRQAEILGSAETYYVA